MLAESASATKKGGQDLLGGLDVKVLRNRYGTQVQSFVANLDLPFLAAAPGEPVAPFRGVFIRAPVVEEILTPAADEGSDVATVQVLAVCKQPDARPDDKHDIVAVRQRNVFGTSFHPELTDDTRIHEWWLRQVLEAVRGGRHGLAVPETVAR